MFEYDLLDANDRELYHSLQDKFDKKVINKVILKVRKRIEELLNKDEEFIEVKVCSTILSRFRNYQQEEAKRLCRLRISS